MEFFKVSSSAGRAAVSKTAGRRFDPCLTCQMESYHEITGVCIANFVHLTI